MCRPWSFNSWDKKAELVDRLFSFMHPSGSSSEGRLQAIDNDTSSEMDEEDDTPLLSAVTQPSSSRSQVTVSPSLEEIRTLIRQEISSAQLSQNAQQTVVNQPLLQNQNPLSPNSTSQIPVAQQTSQPITHTLLQSTQGLSPIVSSIYLPQICGNTSSLLPPISEKLFSEIRKKQFIDFNSLLPNALYDQISNTENLCFELNRSPDGEHLLALQPKKSQKRKNNSPSAWLEAWNISLEPLLTSTQAWCLIC